MLDELDRKILKEIQENPRIKATKLAQKLGKPRTTILQRLSRLEKEGIITGYRALINPEKLGFKYSALVMVKIRKGLKSLMTQTEIAEKIIRECSKSRNLPFVEEVFVVTGAYDMALKVWIREWRDLTAFLLEYLPSMEEIQSTETLMVLERTPKQPSPFPV
ncbi:MAG: Lrp/AsnC family transcriptional regulator [Desulfurococcales archaeon]|nr:Lrp/AsnC family transcriptional regulator [Desulfurococcales archaeon]